MTNGLYSCERAIDVYISVATPGWKAVAQNFETQKKTERHIV